MPDDGYGEQGKPESFDVVAKFPHGRDNDEFTVSIRHVGEHLPRVLLRLDRARSDRPIRLEFVASALDDVLCSLSLARALLVRQLGPQSTSPPGLKRWGTYAPTAPDDGEGGAR